MATNSIRNASFARSPRFPAAAFKSHEEFQSYLGEYQSLLDVHYAYELSLATHDDFLTCKGTCAVCLRPAIFVSSTLDGEKTVDGRRMPNWREQMRCDCEDRLIGRQRALIHFLQATVLTPWTNMLLFGPPSLADRKLARLTGEVTTVQHLKRSRTSAYDSSVPVLDGPSANFHAVVSQDYLNVVPPLQAVLEEIFRVLLPGGRFVFTIPFHVIASTSEIITSDVLSYAPEAPIEFRGTSHKLGWDLLSMLTKTGFREAAAHLYWSEELGYLGSMNFVFKAVK